MRTFGFIAAFTAFTSVFAAPLSAPGPNSIALEARINTPAVPTTPDVPDVNTPAVPTVDSVGVAVSIGGICLGVQVNLKAIVEQIDAVLDNTEDTVEDKVEEIKPLLNKVVIVLTGAVGQITANPVGTVTGNVNSLATTVTNTITTLADLGALLKTIQVTLVDVLCKVATLIGKDFPAVAELLRDIISALWILTHSIIKLVGGLGLPSLLSGVHTVIAETGIALPDIN